MQNTISFRVYYEDTDAQGIVYHANYLKFCERARSEMLLMANIGGFSQNEYFVVSEINAKFIAPAKLNDMISVSTKVIKMGASKVVLKQTISLKDEPSKAIFEAVVTLAHIKDTKVARISEELSHFFKSMI